MSLFLIGHVQGPERGGDQERGEREADLVIETEVDAEAAHAPEAGGRAVLVIADVAIPEIEREGITEVDRERKSVQAQEIDGGHGPEMVGGDHDLETGRKVARGKGGDQDRGIERGGHRLGIESSEGEANLGRETNSNSCLILLKLFFSPIIYNYSSNN